MSKVKQWAWDEAEKAVDKIILQVKQNLISKEQAKIDIMNVQNVDLCSIDEHNVDEVIEMELSCLMTLLEHIKNINAKSKKWMEENPGSWAGMVTEDIKYWNDQGIFTVEDYERDSLITSVYEMHKDAYGVKGRHYNFKEMSNEDLQKELDSLCKVAKESAEQEKKWEEACLPNFLKNCKHHN